ncbi:YceI family protein [Thermoflexus sp.]|uniref:YceI family protein n=1 Tax=Thermoflexus sp. TaxID=1969742 RepID=UPI0025E50855|nr:YceI family protein [Thermoflexus sp.]MCS6963031.1 YceI family protein [Thermoflexus sp.]MCS7350038.1 YceI family protein [Thermoflexus sp.]MCX7691006.1 YceI family protein [Thermoflexus sp.]MDW8179486.1 YceI family protein [Anaerolineae bacterium]
MHRFPARIAWFLLISIGLIACGSPATPTPLPSTPTSVATPVVSDQPSPTPVSPATPTSPPGPGAEQTTFIVVSEESEARYRVREQLVGFDLPNDAVGTTRAITGVLVMEGNRVVAEASRFQVDLRTLTSDQSRRDNFIRRNTLQADRYPYAVFVPREVQGLPSPLPTSGEHAFQLIGDLTVRDVTRPVTWEVTARVEGNRVIAQARTQFAFADFNLEQPRVPVVLSVDEIIRLEIDAVLQRQ